MTSGFLRQKNGELSELKPSELAWCLILIENFRRRNAKTAKEVIDQVRSVPHTSDWHRQPHQSQVARLHDGDAAAQAAHLDLPRHSSLLEVEGR